VFFALAGGMAAGAGNHAIGVIGSALIGIVIVIFYLTDYGVARKKELLLTFYLQPHPGDEAIYLPVFNEFLSSYTLLNIKSARMGQFLELSFHVRLKNIKDYEKFVNDLSVLEGLERVSLIFGEESGD